jgi:hypothetical protein
MPARMWALIASGDSSSWSLTIGQSSKELGWAAASLGTNPASAATPATVANEIRFFTCYHNL